MEKKKETKGTYTRGQRICALALAILLLGMYLVTLAAAVTTSPEAPELFKMSLGASILLPILFWCYLRFAKLLSGKGGQEG